MTDSDQSSIELRLGNEFDLHTFQPRDIPSVTEEYLIEAQRLGYREVRLIHGKGIGYQRQVVRTILSQLPIVEAYSDDLNGNRGATIVKLK